MMSGIIFCLSIAALSGVIYWISIIPDTNDDDEDDDFLKPYNK